MASGCHAGRGRPSLLSLQSCPAVTQFRFGSDPFHRCALKASVPQLWKPPEVFCNFAPSSRILSPAFILRDRKIPACTRDRISFEVDSSYSEAQHPNPIRGLRGPSTATLGNVCAWTPPCAWAGWWLRIQVSISPDGQWSRGVCRRKQDPQVFLKTRL